MKEVKMTIECPACSGTGLYQGMGEGKGTAVICHKCRGTGAYQYFYSYNEFTGRKNKEGVNRVYLPGTGYKLALGKINFSNGIGEIDMDREGISYADFLEGKRPIHIKKLYCPLSADQGACHKIKGFANTCNDLNGGWLSYIPSCKHNNKKGKELCWARFENGINPEEKMTDVLKGED